MFNLTEEEFETMFTETLNNKVSEFLEYYADQMTEEIFEDLRVIRVNRIRKGKLQRRKKVSNKVGYKLQGNKLVKIKAAERKNRRISQRKAAKKRKAKSGITKRSMDKSLRKRAARGLDN